MHHPHGIRPHITITSAAISQLCVRGTANCQLMASFPSSYALARIIPCVLEMAHECVCKWYTPLRATHYRSLTQTSVLNLFQSPLAVSRQRLYQWRFSASHTQVLLSEPPVQNSCQLTTELSPMPFHTNLLVFYSQADFQLN
jgi:hypothetical protein